MMELVEIQTAKETSFNKKRGTNWTPEEEILLIEEVLKYEETLFGKMKGSGSKGKHGQVKESTWRSIAETLNLNYKNDRDNETIKKKFNNIKQRGKEKISMLRRPKTGGGPAPPSLTASEDALMQAFDGRPQICGLADGIDTDANDETTETSKDVESITLAPGTTSSTSSTSKPSASTSSSLSERSTASKNTSAWKPHIRVLDANRQEMFVLRGPCCWGCQNVYCTDDIEFSVTDQAEDKYLGRMFKRWAGCGRETFTDADTFGVTFPLDMPVPAKALLFGAVFLVDFMYFERAKHSY